MGFWKSKRTALDDEIDRLYVELNNHQPGTEEYKELLTITERLTLLKKTNVLGRPSPDTMAVVLGNLAIAALTIGYEHGHVVTNRGLAFLLRANHN